MAGYVWLNHKLQFQIGPIQLRIEPQSSIKMVAKSITQGGVNVQPQLLYWWFRLSGQSKNVKSGSYQLNQGLTPITLLQKLVKGDQILKAVTFVEGWNFTQIRNALVNAEDLKPDSKDFSVQELMKKVTNQDINAEGRFFPDTYLYSPGDSDLVILRKAYDLMQVKLNQAWAARASDSPLKSTDELLILASIVEKETGMANDRAMIAGVFSNRLSLGMLLQTDPTVIYGMGTEFTGDLKREHLRKDTPWNTYTRIGLPISPICMPGEKALIAAATPAKTDALFFVSRGDGSSEFSVNLKQHNQAVNKYQRNRK